MDEKRLKSRCDTFLIEVELPVTKFLKHVGIARTTFYEWRNGNLNLSPERLENIDRFLSRLGY